MSYEDNTNVEHPYQGQIRFAPLDSGLWSRCAADINGKPNIVLTHCDQLAPPNDVRASFYSFGPDRNAVYTSNALAIGF